MLKHVLWIGGPPGAGKTSIALRIARRHGLRWYGADTRTWAHRDRALGAGHAAAQRWESSSQEERWLVAPEELLELSLHRERGPMVVDDLRALPSSPLIVAEGSPLAPDLVTTGIADSRRAIWLLPTPEFHEAQLRRRKLDPGPRELYLLLADEIEREAREEAVPTLAVDGSKGVDEIAAAVADHFADALAMGPRAHAQSERQALLREGNEAIAAQVRAYYARPWAAGDADSVIRTFVCECGVDQCDATLELSVGEMSAGPVLATGHVEA